MQMPPETEQNPVTEQQHGYEITDPYRWLEGDSDAVTDWERRQNEFTDEVVETERRESLAPDFETLGYHASYDLPTVRGGRYFQRIEATEADQPALTVRDSLEADPETLVDPEDLGETTALQWFVPDTDGERVLYGLIDAGTEQYDLCVRAVDSGELVDRIDDIGRCNPAGVAWDGDGFYYTATGDAGGGDQLDKELRYHEVGGDDQLVSAAFQPECWPMIQIDHETGVVVVVVSELAADSELYVLADGKLEPVLTGIDASFDPLVLDGRVYVRTNHDSPRGKLLATDAIAVSEIESPDDFETVIPEDRDVLLDVIPAGNGIAVSRLRDAQSVLSLHHPDGTHRHDVSLPEFAGIQPDGIEGSEESPELFVQLSGFDRPESIVHVDAHASAAPDDWSVVQSPELPPAYDPQADLSLTVTQHWVDSTAEASVPMYVVHRADLEPDGDAPTVLYGYGGFRIPMVPYFDPYRLPFLADGGVFALACLRGGIEFGEQWHEEGTREQKEHTFDDFEAAARALVDRGYTTADRLAAWGASNGGLTVGAALTRSPDLFGAVVCSVPLLDMYRYNRLLLGQAWTPEYGSPDEQEPFEWLRSYSPYHNVGPQSYPATLFATAAGDTRVHPGHARKMTARVQNETTGDEPVCYRSVEETGHGVGTPTGLEIQQQLDRWAFVYESLDIGRQ